MARMIAGIDEEELARREAERAAKEAEEAASKEAAKAQADAQEQTAKAQEDAQRASDEAQRATVEAAKKAQEQGFNRTVQEKIHGMEVTLLDAGDIQSNALTPELQEELNKKNRKGELGYGTSWGATNEVSPDYSTIKDNEQAVFFGTLVDEEDRLQYFKEYAQASGQNLEDVLAYADDRLGTRIFATPQSNAGKRNTMLDALDGLDLFDIAGEDIDVYSADFDVLVQSLNNIADEETRKDGAAYLESLTKIPGSPFYGRTFSKDDIAYRDSADLPESIYKEEIKALGGTFKVGQGFEDVNKEEYLAKFQKFHALYGDNPYAFRQMESALRSAYEKQTGYVAPKASDVIAALEEMATQAAQNPPNEEDKGFFDWFFGLFTGKKKEKPTVETEEPKKPVEGEDYSFRDEYIASAGPMPTMTPPYAAPAPAPTAEAAEPAQTEEKSGGRWIDALADQQQETQRQADPQEPMSETEALKWCKEGRANELSEENYSLVKDVWENDTFRSLALFGIRPTDQQLYDQDNSNGYPLAEEDRLERTFETKNAYQLLGKTLGGVADTLNSGSMPEDIALEGQLLLGDIINLVDRRVRGGRVHVPKNANKYEYVISQFDDLQKKTEQLTGLQARVNAINANKAIEAAHDYDRKVESAETALLSGRPLTQEQIMLLSENAKAVSAETIRSDKTRRDMRYLLNPDGIASYYKDDGAFWTGNSAAAQEGQRLRETHSEGKYDLYKYELREAALETIDDLTNMAYEHGMTLEQMMTRMGIGIDQVMDMSYNRINAQGNRILNDPEVVQMVESIQNGEVKSIGWLNAVGSGAAYADQSNKYHFMNAPYQVLDIATYETRRQEIYAEFDDKYKSLAAPMYRKTLIDYANSGEMPQDEAKALLENVSDADNIFDVAFDIDPGWLASNWREAMWEFKKDMNAIEETASSLPEFEKALFSGTANVVGNFERTAASGAISVAAGALGAPVWLSKLIGSTPHTFTGFSQTLQENRQAGLSDPVAAWMAFGETAVMSYIESFGAENVAMDTFFSKALARNGMEAALRQTGTGGLNVFKAMTKAAVLDYGLPEAGEEVVQTLAGSAIDKFIPAIVGVEQGTVTTPAEFVSTTLQEFKATDYAELFRETVVSGAGGFIMGALVSMPVVGANTFNAVRNVNLQKKYSSIDIASQIVHGEIPASDENIGRFIDAMRKDSQDPQFRNVYNKTSDAAMQMEMMSVSAMSGVGHDLRVSAIAESKKAIEYDGKAKAARSAVETNKSQFFRAQELAKEGNQGAAHSMEGFRTAWAKAQTTETENTQAAEKSREKAAEYTSKWLQEVRKAANVLMRTTKQSAAARMIDMYHNMQADEMEQGVAEDEANVSAMDVETFIEEKHPNASEEEKAHIREIYNETAKMQENVASEATSVPEAEAESVASEAAQTPAEANETQEIQTVSEQTEELTQGTDPATTAVKTPVQPKNPTTRTATQMPSQNGAQRVESAQKRQIQAAQKFAGQVKRRYGVSTEIAAANDPRLMLPKRNEKGEPMYAPALYNRDTDTIIVSENATQGDILRAKIVHELTHRTEGTDAYREFADAIKAAYFKGNKNNQTSFEQSIRDLYAKNGVNLSDEGLEHEVVSRITEELIGGNEEMVNRLVADSPSVARRIMDAIKNVLDKLTGVKGKDVDDLRKVEKMFQKALNEAAKQRKAGVQFSVDTIVEENSKGLVAVHNMTSEALYDSLTHLKGLPMPSIAVVKAEEGFNQFGEVTFVYDKNSIDPEADERNRLYGNDAFTPTQAITADMRDAGRGTGTFHSWETDKDYAYTSEGITQSMQDRIEQSKYDPDSPYTPYSEKGIPHELEVNAAKTYGSIEEMKADQNRLTDDVFEIAATNKKLRGKLNDLITELRASGKTDYILSLKDVTLDVLDKAALRITRTSPTSVLREDPYSVVVEEFGKEGIEDLPSDVYNMAVDLIDEYSNIGTQYFEAKAYRSVPLDEVRFILVPEGIKPEIMDEVVKSGIPFAEYSSRKDRREKLNSINDVQFSIPDTFSEETGEVLTGTIGGDTVVQYSLKSWTPEEQSTVRSNLIGKGFDEDDVDDWIDDVNSVAAIVSADRDRLDFEAADNQVMLKPNAEYVRTLDASTLCAKRLLYQGTFNAIQHRMPNKVMTSDDLIRLRNMMAEAGYETPCGICYVESRRRNLGTFAQKWLKDYDAKGGYQPKLDDVTTTDGLERMRTQHPEVYDSFVNEMKRKGSNNPKVVQLRTDYRGDIRKLSKSDIDKIIKIGGLRVQSFSDFETPHLLDMMQAVLDMTENNLTSQAYTKVPNFAWVFGDTGIKINLSLIAEGDGFDADGNLAFSSYEGMDFDEAMRLRDRYSENVGTILVGLSDKHIRAAMADPRIDFIIPFHKSGWGKRQLSQLSGMSGYMDYTRDQNERRIIGETKTGKPKTKNVEENFHPVDYWDYNLTGNQNAETYLRMCEEDGRIPKFSRFLSKDTDGHWVAPDGYWKLLIDFKMYDNDGVGAPQMPVRPNFNMEEARRILGEYEGGANELPVAHDIVDRFVNQKDQNSVQYSLDDIYNYTEKTYNERGWMQVNDIISPNEYATINRRYSDLRNGDHMDRTADGKYIFDVGLEFGINPVVVITNGGYVNPRYERVYRIYKNTESEIERYRYVIHAAEAGEEQARATLADFVEEGMVGRYDRRDFGTFAELKREAALERPRGGGRKGSRNSSGKQVPGGMSGGSGSNVNFSIDGPTLPDDDFLRAEIDEWKRSGASYSVDPQADTGKRQFATKTIQENAYVPDHIKQTFLNDPDKANYSREYNARQLDKAWNRVRSEGIDGVKNRLLTQDTTFTTEDNADALVLMSQSLHDDDLDTFMSIASKYNVEGTNQAKALQIRSLMKTMTPTGFAQKVIRDASQKMEEHLKNHNRQSKKIARKVKDIDEKLGLRNLDGRSGIQKLVEAGESIKIDNKYGVPLNDQQRVLIKEFGLEKVRHPGMFYNWASTKQRMLMDILTTDDVYAEDYNGFNLVERLIRMEAGQPVVTKADISYITENMNLFNSYADRNSREADIALSRAYEAYGNINPASGKMKRRTWRYTSMLLSVPSAIRNVIGNAAQSIPNAIADGVAVELDRFFSAVTGEDRTRAHINIRDRIDGWEAFRDETFNTFRDYFIDKTITQHGEGRYNQSQRGRVFENQFGETLRRMEGLLMSVGDRNFWKKKFFNSLAEQQHLAEINGTEFNLESAMEVAEAEANYATFNEDNAVRSLFTKMKDIPAIGAVVDHLMPFTGVPTNIIKRQIEFSPLGIAATAWTHGVNAIRGGDFDQRAFVDGMARGLTGSAMMGIGALLLKAGILKLGTKEEDDDKSYGIRTAQGDQYGVYFTLGGKNYSISTFSPAASALVAGAFVADALGDNESWYMALINGTLKNVNEIFEASYMSSLADLLNTSNGKSVVENAIPAIGNAILTQNIPAPISHLASALDPYVRDTKDKDALMEVVKTTMSKIPGARQLLPEKVDVAGRAVENTKYGAAAFIDPFTTSKVVGDPALDEMIRLRDVLTEQGASEPRAHMATDALSGRRNTLTQNKVTYTVTPEEKEAYRKRYGELWREGGVTYDKKGKRTIVQGVEELIASRRYQLMNDEEKADAIHEILLLAKNGATYEIMNHK